MRHHFLQILPDFAFRGGIAQQIGGVIRGHQFRAAIIEPLAAKSRNSLVVFRSACAAARRGSNHFRLNHIQLAKQKRRAGRDFVFLRHAIFRRAALHDVADVNLFARKPMASIICVSSFPARPTNGRPCMSSSWPGPSPTNTSSAFGFPTPKQSCCAPLCSLQRVHSADVRANAFERVALDALVKKRRTEDW